MHKRLIISLLSLFFLSVFILSFSIGQEDSPEYILNGTSEGGEINKSSWNLTERGIDFDLYLTDEINSSYYMELSSYPINYFNGSEFEPINTTIVSSGCEYNYCVRKGVYFADFYEDYNPSGMIKFNNNGTNVIYTPISLTYYNGSTEQVIANTTENTNGYANDNIFIYSSIFGSGFDLEYNYMNNILKEDFIITNISALPAPNLTGEVYLNLNFKMSTSDEVYVGVENETGDIVFNAFEENSTEYNLSMVKGVNFNENKVYYILKPYVADANQSQQRISYTLSSVSGNKVISIVTPYSWLNDSTRQYPVIIDPSTGNENASTDYNIWKVIYPNGTISQWQYGSSTPTVPVLSTGNFWSFGLNRYKRAIVRFPLSSTARNILLSATSYDGFYIELYDLLEYANSSNDNLQIGVIDQNYPRSLTPTTNRDLDDLFNKTDDISAGSNIWQNRIWPLSNPQVNTVNVLHAIGIESDAVITNVVNNNESFIIGLSGFQTSGITNEVQYRGVPASQDSPKLSIGYICNNQPAPSCESCLNQGSGLSCDCEGECSASASYCVGTNATNAICSSSCASNGQYSPTGVSCCSGLQWSSSTHICSSSGSSCPIPNGSGPNCDCDNDNECPAGYYCHQQAGYDPCLQRQFCNGTIQVKAFDSHENPINGVKVYLNSTLQGTTNSGGYRDLAVNNVACGALNNIETKCSDNTFCDSGNIAIDYNGENDTIQFDCSICTANNKDLFISQGDIILNYSESGSISQVNVSVDVHSQNHNVNNLKVRFNLIGKDGLIKDTETNTINIAPNTIVSTSTSLTSNPDKVIYVTIQVDPNNEVNDDPKTNNFVRRVVSGRIRGYLDINTGFSEVNSKIRDFMESFVEPVSLSNAQIVYSVGRFSSYASNLTASTTPDCILFNNQILVEGIFLDNPYTGAICSFMATNGKTIVAAVGSDIDGDIAAVKKLGSAADVYFRGTAVKPRIVIDWNDLTAIGVYDYLHNSENFPHYHRNTPQFGNITEKILNGNTYDVAIRLVNTTNANPTTLRVKNVNSDFSANYRNTLASGNTRPVVLSGGLFNNLEMWEGEYTGQNFNDKGLAKQLAESGRDTWEIEVTGGPIAENISALNYNYNTLVDNYWVASLAAIQYYTGKITLDYVGFSNGCRTALTGIEKYQTTPISNIAIVQNLMTGNFQTVGLQANSGANLVHTFIGVACPGAFEGESYLIEQVNQYPNSVAQLQAQQNWHPDLDDIARELIFIGGGFLPDKYPISLNLWSHYNDAILLNNDSQPGNFSINRAKIFYGLGGLNGIGSELDDGIVTALDNLEIASNINSTNVDQIANYRTNHRSITDKSQVKQDILEFLSNG